ncbi:MAG TPA: cupredoxin domain-containing protein [Anaerolineae bacterium]|nr:cupredoxin domain-containing protein [Anaerolineae bacterium]
MSSIALRARVVLLVSLALALAACGGTAPATSDTMSEEPQEVTMTMQEFKFDPTEISARVGRPVKVTLVNKGTLLHDFSSMDAKVEVVSMQEGAAHDMGGMESQMTMHMAVDASTTETLEFKPTEAGTYEFYCSVEGHKEAGMVGQLIVTP